LKIPETELLGILIEESAQYWREAPKPLRQDPKMLFDRGALAQPHQLQ
jgi:hypothetical protein